MNNFYATLNGKTYTNRKEFLNALRSIKNNEVKEMTVGKKQIDAGKPCVQLAETRNATTELTDEQRAAASMLLPLLGLFAGAFDPSIFNNNEIHENKPGNTITNDNPSNNNNVEALRESLKKKIEAEYSKLIEMFVFTDLSTINMTGEEEHDEQILDNMSKIMSRAFKTLPRTVDFDNKSILMLRDKVLAERQNALKWAGINDVDSILKRLDNDMYEIEQYMKTADKFGFHVGADVKSRNSDLQRKFNFYKTQDGDRKRSYHKMYRLLVDYYGDVLKYLGVDVKD